MSRQSPDQPASAPDNARRSILGVIRGMDPGLIAALMLAFIFTVQGINWGRVECWNPDEVALRSIKKSPPFEPATFVKPPFHTYLTRIFVIAPVQAIEGVTLFLEGRKGEVHKAGSPFNVAILLGARFLTLTLLLGSVWLSFLITRDATGLFAARVVALLMATSAGFIAAAHYLTADSPMLFWMLLAFYFCQRFLFTGAMSTYLLAGLVTGLATATKYNALAVGIAIPVAHLLRSRSIKEALWDRRAYLSVFMVPVGFLLACPYALLDHRKFVKDFMYNYAVAPHYGGQMGGNGYATFFTHYPDVLGWPGALWVLLAVAGSGALVIVRRASPAGARTFIAAAAVTLLYYYKIGSFPRLETRFVLPSIPFVVLMVAPFLEVSAVRPRLLALPLVLIFIYNCICSFFVGIRFEDDPRMAAQSWVLTHVQNGASIESTQHTPHWNKLPGVSLDSREAPNSNARGALFNKIFSGNPWVMDSLEEREGHADPANFTLAALQTRNPEYIALDSLGYQGAEDPAIKDYFASLLAEKFPYRIVLDLTNPPMPAWLYPHSLDFLVQRITILRRSSSSGEPSSP